MQTFGLETSAGALEMRVSSDLMDNHLIGEAVVIGRGVRTVRDSDGRAMAFVLEAGKLYVVLRSASQASGIHVTRASRATT